MGHRRSRSCSIRCSPRKRRCLQGRAVDSACARHQSLTYRRNLPLRGVSTLSAHRNLHPSGIRGRARERPWNRRLARRTVATTTRTGDCVTRRRAASAESRAGAVELVGARRPPAPPSQPFYASLFVAGATWTLPCTIAVGFADGHRAGVERCRVDSVEVTARQTRARIACWFVQEPAIAEPHPAIITYVMTADGLYIGDATGEPDLHAAPHLQTAAGNDGDPWSRVAPSRCTPTRSCVTTARGAASTRP